MISLMLFANLGLNLLGIIFFLFLFWKRLREDYSSELIFKTAFLTIFGIGIFWLISFKFLPAWFLWFTFLGALLGISLSIYRFHLRTYEVIESLVISVMPWLAIVFLANSVFNSSLSSFLGFVAILIFIFVFYYLDVHYKNFTWYKSGRVGLTGLVIVALIFITRFVVVIFNTSVLSFVSQKLELILSGVMFAIVTFFIYKLSKDE